MPHLASREEPPVVAASFTYYVTTGNRHPIYNWGSQLHLVRVLFMPVAGRYVYLLGLLLALLSATTLARQAVGSLLAARVIGIADGDTVILLLPSQEELKVRLAGIDTPEHGEPYFRAAKQALASRVFQQTVAMEITDWDRYGRAVGIIRIDGENINAWMVAQGHATVYRRYSHDPELDRLEASAKAANKGVWSLRTTRCKIKGNINGKGARIYHLPGSASYKATKINEAKGERWFCSEQEAKLAGWRAPRG